MNKLLHIAIIILTAVTVGTVIAAAPAQTAKSGRDSRQKMTKEQFEEMRYKSTGGFLPKPGTPYGKIAFINAQSLVSITNLQGAIDMLGKTYPKFNFAVETASASKDYEGMKKNSGAQVAVILVADESTPVMLAAPEDNWAVVNVNKLKRGLKTPGAIKKFLESRVRKELVRAYVCVAGGLTSSFPGNIMSISKLEDLDFRDEFLPFDKVDATTKYLRSINVQPAMMVSYRKACIDGWAPAPTNDVQRVIVEKARIYKEKKAAKEASQK
jgi:hypothetical protein